MSSGLYAFICVLSSINFFLRLSFFIEFRICFSSSLIIFRSISISRPFFLRNALFRLFLTVLYLSLSSSYSSLATSPTRSIRIRSSMNPASSDFLVARFFFSLFLGFKLVSGLFKFLFFFAFFFRCRFSRFFRK